MATDFPYKILDQLDHRPWPPPDRPWVMTQSWHDLLFAHWPVALEALRDRVPAMLPIDVYDGQAWLGIVAFRMTNVAPRGVPSMPFVSAFMELNVRTYVTLRGRPGVYFFSLDAASTLAVAAARALFGLPYHVADMEMTPAADGIRYRSRRQSSDGPAAAFEATYRAGGAVRPPERGSLEYFLTERYCLYTADGGQRVRRLDIHHPPWALQPAEAEIRENTMAAAAGITLPTTPPLLHFARRQDMVAWLPEAADG